MTTESPGSELLGLAEQRALVRLVSPKGKSGKRARE